MADSTAPAFTRSCSYITWTLLAWFAALLFFHLEGASLWYADEYRGAERAREFLVTGDFWTVRENFQPNFHKPPLHYWLSASTLRVLGEGKFAMRFWTWVFTVGTLALSALYARLLVPALPLAAPLTLATVALYGPFVEYVQIGLLDAGLMFWTLAVLVCAERARTNARWFLAAGLCAGLGSLYKVPLPLGVWMVSLGLRARDRENWQTMKRSRALRGGLALAGALTVAWPVIQIAQHGAQWWKVYVQGEGGVLLLKQGKRKDFGLATYPMWLVSKWWIFGLLTLAGLGWVWWKGRSPGRGHPWAVRLYEAAVIASLYLAAASLLQAKSQRYVLPALPLLAVIGVVFFLRWPMPARWRAVCVVVGLLPLLIGFWPHYYKRDRLDFSTRIGMARSFGASKVEAQFLFVIDGAVEPEFLLFFGRLQQPVYSLPRELAVAIGGTWHGLISSDDWPALARDVPGTRKIADHGCVVEFARN